MYSDYIAIHTLFRNNYYDKHYRVEDFSMVTIKEGRTILYIVPQRLSAPIPNEQFVYKQPLNKEGHICLKVKKRV